MKLINQHNYELSSGRQFYANHGLISIGHDGDVAEGYDGGIGLDDWTKEERQELADHMIEQWAKWRDDALTQRESHE